MVHLLKQHAHVGRIQLKDLRQLVDGEVRVLIMLFNIACDPAA